MAKYLAHKAAHGAAKKEAAEGARRAAGERGSASDDGDRRKEMYRQKSFEFALGEDAQMAASIGHPWVEFLMDRDPAKGPSPWRCKLLVKAADSRLDVRAKRHFMQRQLLANTKEHPDASHNIWNDSKLALGLARHVDPHRAQAHRAQARDPSRGLRGRGRKHGAAGCGKNIQNFAF